MQIAARQHYLDTARHLWQQYQLLGPGRVKPALYQNLVAAKTPFETDAALDDPWCRSVQRLQELAERCVLRSEGLCFVSGEAGLIPDRALHREMERLLEDMQQLVRLKT